MVGNCEYDLKQDPNNLTPWPYLHEEPGDQGFPDVEVVVPTGKVSAGAAEVEPVHDPGQLLSHIVRALQRPVVDKVVIAPLGVFLACKSKYNTVLHVLLL